MQKNQKQYSSFNKLPNNENEIITIIPRNILKNDKIFDFNSKYELPLFLYLTNVLLNQKNDKMDTDEMLLLKKSKMRNFLRKRCHSTSKEKLNEIINIFMEKLKSNILNMDLFDFEQVSAERYLMNVSKKYLKRLSSNTVSVNLLGLTKLRGEKAKKVFLKLHAFDMRDTGVRYFTLINLSDFLGLDWRNKRKNVIRRIKNVFSVLAKKGFVENILYTGELENNRTESYKFKYSLGSIKQLFKK